MNFDIFKKNYYEIKTKCNNCDHKQITRIRKGNKPEEVLNKGVCENCGVKELKEI